MAVRQILTDWTTSSGAGKVSVMYFDAATAVATQRTALQAFWTATKAALDNATSYVIRTTGVDLDESTGQLVASWAETSAKTGTGAGVGDPVPDASMVLVRWKTSTILGSRFLQGRTFIPGLGAGNVTDGNLAPAAIAVIDPAAATLVGSAAALQVWHRPVSGSGGSAHSVTSGTCWTELAVLRRRRG